MEILLAIMVGAAVIIFGALISIGNERQRRAIDGLREQVIHWAVQDLKIKREQFALKVQVSDPLNWLNSKVSRVFGRDLKLQVVETFEEPPSISCISGDDGLKVILSLFSPSDIRRFRKNNRSRLSQFTVSHPLFSLPRGVVVHEMSVLNDGMMFDVELNLVWKALTGQAIDDANRIWIYAYP